MHVSKINLKRAQQLKDEDRYRQNLKLYQPPDKSLTKSQFSGIFSEPDQVKECAVLGQSLTNLNVTKSKDSLKL